MQEGYAMTPLAEAPLKIVYRVFIETLSHTPDGVVVSIGSDYLLAIGNGL